MRLRSRNALSRGDGVGGKDEDCGEDEKDEDDDAPFAGSPWQSTRCRGKKDPGSADGDAMADDAGDDEEDEDEKDEDDDAISEARDEVGRGAEGTASGALRPWSPALRSRRCLRCRPRRSEGRSH